MRKSFGPALLTLLLCGFCVSARSADNDAAGLIDKAIAALGGEAKLSQGKAMTWNTKGTFTFGDNESQFTGSATAAGIDRIRQEFEGDFGGNKIKGVTVLDGDKGWRRFGDTTMPLDADGVSNEKRSVYLQVVPVTLLPLKGKGFKVESAGDEKLAGADAAGIKVTAPDGKDFKMFFDKQSHLPVKVVATVRGFQGQDFTQETTYADYKDLGGIKKATKIAAKRDGSPFLESEISDFKFLDTVDDKTFAEPQ
jgi:hypothetical protein